MSFLRNAPAISSPASLLVSCERSPEAIRTDLTNRSGLRAGCLPRPPTMHIDGAGLPCPLRDGELARFFSRAPSNHRSLITGQWGVRAWAPALDELSFIVSAARTSTIGFIVPDTSCGTQ